MTQNDQPPVPRTRSAAGSHPGEPTRPDVGGWLGKAFTLFGEKPAVYIAQGAIVTLPTLAFQIVDLGLNISNEFQRTPDEQIVFGLFGMVLGVWTVLLLPGLMKTADKHLRGGTPRVGDVFSGFDKALPFLGAMIVVGLATGIGAIFCILPAFLVAALFTHVGALIVVGDRSVGDALGQSWNVVKTPHFWPYVGWAVVIWLVGSLAPAFTCGLGGLVFTPVVAAAQVVAYRAVFEGGGFDVDAEEVFG